MTLSRFSELLDQSYFSALGPTAQEQYRDHEMSVVRPSVSR